MSIQTYQLANIADRIKIFGRHQILSSGITCDFTASGIELSLCATGEVILTVRSTAEVFFTVFVDGVRDERRWRVPKGDTELSLAGFSDGQQHTLRVLKQNEPRHALCELISLRFDGTLADRPANAPHLIEFIGDSITCGYGNLCHKGTEEAGSALHQDGTRAFAYLTAQALGVDHSMVSHSGIGITKGYASFPMRTLYPKRCYLRDANASFTPDRIPSLAVINLGTNDKGRGADPAQFVRDASDLIDTVRTLYSPTLPVVWVCNMLHEGYMGHIRALLEQRGGEAAGLYLCEMEPDKSGGDSHPILAAHEAASKRLSAWIRALGLLG